MQSLGSAGVMDIMFRLLGFSLITTVVSWKTTIGADVIVEFPSLPSTVAGTCDIPDNIDVIIHMQTVTISLQLVKSKGVNENIPVLFLRRNRNGTPRISSHGVFVGNSKMKAFYQAHDRDAAFEVTCSPNRSTLVLEGSLKLQDGKIYRMKTSADKVVNRYTLTENTRGALLAGNVHIIDDIDDSTNFVSRHGFLLRSRRNTEALELSSDIYVDVVTLIDNSIFQIWYSRSTQTTADQKRQDALESVSLHFANVFKAVNQRYQKISSKLHINLAGLIIADISNGDWFQSVLDNEPDKARIHASSLLESMIVLSQTNGFPQHDHLLSFSGLDLYWILNGQPQYNLTGLARTGQICVENGKSVSVVEFHEHFAVDVFVAAHEIGHGLGARHDGTNGNTCSSADNFIMTGSPAVYTNTNPFTFSTCSVAYFENHINNLLTSGSTYSRTCLLQPLNPASSVPVVTDADLPGQLFTFDEQCQLVYGSDSYVCRTGDLSSPTICLQKSCFNSTDSFCYTRYAARGTTCGDKQWCDGGECVYSNSAPSADPSCLLGDRPGIFGLGCRNFVNPTLCSIDNIKQQCCESCKEIACGQQCQNNGYINSTTCQCKCRPCYTGESCENSPRVCLNGGALNTSNCGCTCSQYWTGDTCETCNKVCENGGTLDPSTCQCSCPVLWTGEVCASETCTKTCENGGTLNRIPCECICPTAWTGDTCASATCTKTCENGGTLDRIPCECICPTAWTGDTCETATCNKQCAHGGTLDQSVCQCRCYGDWKGDTCEVIGQGVGVGVGVFLLSGAVIGLHVSVVLYFVLKRNPLDSLKGFVYSHTDHCCKYTP